MAYMRGHYYVWSDSEDWLHVWVTNGYDGWDESIWACDENDKRHEGMENASGVRLPQKVMDEYVAMRIAELIIDGKVADTIDRVFSPEGQGGNFGSMVLEKNKEKLKAALSQIKLDEPE